MKIPKKLKCGGLIFEVKESQEIANSSGTFGQTHFRQQKIFLEKSEKQQKKEQTFIHEIIHICLWQSGILARLNRIDKDLEEDIVSSIDNNLYQILKDNKLSI